MAVLKMPKPIPGTESERWDEAAVLLGKIQETDFGRMTTWEVELVGSLHEGKACTRIRLKELRELVARVRDDKSVL